MRPDGRMAICARILKNEKRRTSGRLYLDDGEIRFSKGKYNVSQK